MVLKSDGGNGVEVLLTSDNLTNEVINDIEKIVSIILESPLGEYVDMCDFNKRIRTLKVENRDIKDPLRYNISNNTLEINPKFESDDYDYRFLLTKEVLLMIAPPGGILGDPKYRDLDQGIRDNFAEALVGNNGKTDYEDAKYVASLFAIIFDN
jgi:hypothetical protein